MPRECTSISAVPHGPFRGFRQWHLRAYDGTRLIAEVSEDMKSNQVKLEALQAKLAQAGYVLTQAQLDELRAKLHTNFESTTGAGSFRNKIISTLLPETEEGRAKVKLDRGPCDRQAAACCVQPAREPVIFHPDGFKSPSLSVSEYLVKHSDLAGDARLQWKKHQLRHFRRRHELQGTEDQQQAVHAFTVECGLYRFLNEQMRAGNEAALAAPDFRSHLDYIWLLNTAVRALWVATPCRFLYRGIQAKVDKAAYTPDARVVWPAFSSTSRCPEVARHFARRPDGSLGTLFIIYAPKAARCIEAYSDYPEEMEWLYPINSTFRVPSLDGQRFLLGENDPALQDEPGLDIVVLEETVP